MNAVDTSVGASMIESPMSRKIINAATECLLTHGFNKTTMGTVAEFSGVSRQTIYRAFNNRNELMTRIYVDQFQQKLNQKARKAVQGLPIEDAIIATSLLTAKLVHKNPAMMEIMYGSGASWFQEQMLDTQSPLYKQLIHIADMFWGEKLEAARTAKKLRQDLENLEIFEWLISNHYLQTIRPNSDEERHIRMLEKFVIPSLLNK